MSIREGLTRTPRSQSSSATDISSIQLRMEVQWGFRMLGCRPQHEMKTRPGICYIAIFSLTPIISVCNVGNNSRYPSPPGSFIRKAVRRHAQQADNRIAGTSSIVDVVPPRLLAMANRTSCPQSASMMHPGLASPRGTLTILCTVNVPRHHPDVGASVGCNLRTTAHKGHLLIIGSDMLLVDVMEEVSWSYMPCNLVRLLYASKFRTLHIPSRCLHVGFSTFNHSVSRRYPPCDAWPLQVHKLKSSTIQELRREEV